MSLYGGLSKFSHLSEFGEYAEVDGVLKTPAERKALARANLGLAAPATGPGAGFAGTGTLVKAGVEKIGDLYVARYLLDLTGLTSKDTDNDIIGVAAGGAAYFAHLPASEVGTIYAGRMTCLETPAGGELDINVWAADEATGVYDALITSLTGEVAIFDRAGDWAAGNVLTCGAAVPAAGQYLYLAVGTSSSPTNAAYTAGKFLIELYGYDA